MNVDKLSISFVTVIALFYHSRSMLLLDREIIYSIAMPAEWGTIFSNGVFAPSTPRKYQGIIAAAPTSQRIASVTNAPGMPVEPCAIHTSSGALSAAPIRPTATDRPIPVERKCVGKISEKVG